MDLKKKLILFLVLHVIIVITVNLFSFSGFQNSKMKKLNRLGNWYINEIKLNEPIEPFRSTIGFYSNITGTNRGYEFFSPNVSSGAVKLRFLSDQGQELKLVNSVESDVKLLTATIYYFKKISKTKIRDSITKSICKRLFEKNKDVKNIKVYLKMSHTDPIAQTDSENFYRKEKEILLSTVQKN